MAFKTFAPGVLTSSDVNTFLMRQAVITCTSSTRPSSPSEGMTIYETDTDTLLTYSGTAWENTATVGAWDSYTPTVTNWTIGNGTMVARWAKFGRTVVAEIRVTFGSTSSYSGTPVFTLPTPRIAVTEAFSPVGYAMARDASTGNPVGGATRMYNTASTIHPTWIETASAWGYLQSCTPTYPFTWTSGDEMTMQAIYEAAS